MHGFSGKTTVHDVALDDDGRPLIPLYCGDFDPSGLCMSEADLPKRLAKYNGDHVSLRRVALIPDDLRGLPSFSASDKKKDPRYKWYVANYGELSKRLSGKSEPQCWELDAMNPNDLRSRVGKAIKALIEPIAWKRCERAEKAEQESLRTALSSWNGRPVK
jgi:hypothetical protein